MPRRRRRSLAALPGPVKVTRTRRPKVMPAVTRIGQVANSEAHP